MAKKIAKKVATKVAPKKVEKKVVAKKATKKVDVKVLTNITTIDDLNALIRKAYEAQNEEKIEKAEVAKVLNAFATAFSEFCTNSEEEKATFLLPDVGTFTVKVVPEHDGINPRTMESITIAERKRVTFKPFPRFNNAVNGIEK